MNKYFYKIDENYPYRWDKTCKVELWSGWNANINEDSRVETVSTIASLSYGNEQAKNPQALYEKLKKLKHESIFEFVNLAFFEDRIKNSLRHENIPTFTDYNSIDAQDKDVVKELIDDHKSDIVTFKLTIPIFVARQLVRHRCFSVLELSRRYVKDKKVPFKFYKHHYLEVDDKYKRYTLMKLENDIQTYSLDVYNVLIESGVKPEVARSVLPQGAYTTMFIQGNYQCLKNFFELRLKKDAQEQIRLVANSMKLLLEKYQPTLYNRLFKEDVNEK